MDDRDAHRRDLYARLERDRDRLMQVDGVMSFQTKALVQTHEATSVEMTSWWARTPQRWVCPGCGRDKSQIARRSESGVLLCKLVEHHDHMKDLLVKLFQHHSSTMAHSTADKVAKSFAERSASMISAYENTIICDDCNGADATAKEAVGAHANFSFSAAELRQLVIAEANAAHKIDAAIALKIWKAAEKAFDMRLRIADRIATIAATNTHWFQPTDRKNNPKVIEWNSARVTGEMFGQTIAELCGRDYNAILGEKAKPAGTWRRKIHPLAKRKPTPGELSHLSRVECADDWQHVDEQWRCPGCQRTKVETVRLNNQRKFFFSLNSSSERSKTAPFRPLLICNDCGLTARDMGCEAFKRLDINSNEYAHHVRLSEIQRVVIARPHSRHLINNAVADEVVQEVMARLDAANQEDEFEGLEEYMSEVTAYAGPLDPYA
jgi:rubredoxin